MALDGLPSTGLHGDAPEADVRYLYEVVCSLLALGVLVSAVDLDACFGTANVLLMPLVLVYCVLSIYRAF